MLDTYNLLYFEKGKSYTGFGAMPDISLHHWKPGIRDILENYPAPMSDSWIKYFMDIATVVASKSKDRTKVGCVLVSPTNKQILSTGFNGFCRDVADTPERYADREVKMDYVVHAEANAICFAAFSGMRTDGCYAFVTLPPCHSCAKLLKQAGVTNVFYMEDRSEAPTQEIKDDWRKKQQLSLDILREANIDTYRCCKVNETRSSEPQLIALKDIVQNEQYEDPFIGVHVDIQNYIKEYWEAILGCMKRKHAPTRFMEMINQLGNHEQKKCVVRYLNTTFEEKLFECKRVYLDDFPRFVLGQEGVHDVIDILLHGSEYKVSKVTPV